MPLMQLLETIKTMFHRNATGTGQLPNPACLLPPGGVTGTSGAESATPFVTEFVMVECSHFIGLAYQDAENNWRTAYTDTKLPKPVKVLE